jgi:hypothetical protein
MRILCIWAISALLAFTVNAQQTIASFEEAPLREVLSYLESNFDLVFSFRDQNVQEEYVSLPKGQHEINDLLPLIFEQTNLAYKFIDKRYIILTIRDKSQSSASFLCGFVKDKLSGQALPFASVQIKNSSKGVNANNEGRFEVHNVLDDEILILSYVGYVPIEIKAGKARSKPCNTFYLEFEEFMFDPVVVTEYLTTGIDQSTLGNAVIINPERLSILPGSVEPDVMTSIQMLPGIFSPDESASGIYIRGGTPDQNLVLYDGIPVYHTGHFFGMISAFNPYIVEEVDVYRSGIGTEFGGRVSGVVDIHSDSSIPDGFEIGAGFNFTHGHLNLGIPLAKNSALSLSLRRSFTDFWATPTFKRFAERVFQGTKVEDSDFQSEDLPITDKFYFSDFNFKWVWNPKKSKFGLNFFAGLNNLDYASALPEFNAFSLDVLKLENGGFSAFWEKRWSDKYTSTVRYTNSQYDYNYNLSYSLIEMPDTALISFTSTNVVVDEGFNFINEWRPIKNQKVKFGYQYTDNQIDFGITATGNNETSEESQSFENKLHTLFGEYNLNVANILDLDIGLRFQRQTIIKNDYFEPRVALSTRINDNLKLKLSSSKQFQFISQLIILGINDIGINNQVWISSDNQNIPVIESNQWTGGVIFNKDDWTLDIEAYVKELVGITSLSNSFGELTGQPFSTGNSKIRGVDVLLKKKIGNYRSWLSYTLSKANYEFLSITPDQFPASHDQRHAIQWVNLLSKGPWEFSLGWQIRSGLPVTEPIGVEEATNPVNGNITPFFVYGKQNGTRLKTYHRLDASVMYNFGKKEGFSGFAGISFLNLYNKKNTLGKQFLIDGWNEETLEFDVLSINTAGLKFTPNLVFKVRW